MKLFSNLMQRFLLVILAMSASISIDAHDFGVANEDGVVIYYKIISEADRTCAVTYRGQLYNSYSGVYYGAVKIPETVTYSSINFKVTSIFERAFYGCSSLTSVEIPSSVTNIGIEAFYGCSSLTSIVVESGNSVYDSRNNCNAIIETSSNTLIVGCKNTIIPSSVSSIGNSAFYGCSSLTSITIPSSVSTIGNSAFRYCSSLTFVEIPSSVTNIGIEAFYGCSSLTSVEIPSSMTTIGNSAFYGCDGLTSITIPPSVTSIGNQAFYNCSNLREIIFNSSPHIGSSAFSNDDRISFIYINATTAPYLENKTFSNEVYQYAYLHIPMGML